MSEWVEITNDRAMEIVKRRDLQGVPLGVVDSTYYFRTAEARDNWGAKDKSPEDEAVLIVDWYERDNLKWKARPDFLEEDARWVAFYGPKTAIFREQKLDDA